MKVKIQYNWTEVWEINSESLPDPDMNAPMDVLPFYRWKDKKWIAFCKKHHFHPLKDAYGKIYDLYLRMCGEGLV